MCVCVYSVGEGYDCNYYPAKACITFIRQAVPSSNVLSGEYFGQVFSLRSLAIKQALA